MFDDDEEEDEDEEQPEFNYANEREDSVSEELHSCCEYGETFHTRGEQSTHVKSAHRVQEKNTKESSRHITEASRNNNTCGFISLQNSASTRHKCRNGDLVIFHFLDCKKPCINPGSPNRHMNSKHKNQSAAQLSQAAMSSYKSSWPEPDLAQLSSVSLPESRKSCGICIKTLLNEKNLRKHLERVHGRNEISGEDAGLSANIASAQSTKDVQSESNTASQVSSQSNQGE